MSAQLPYLPPLDAYRQDVATTAAEAAKKVQAAPTAGGKAGLYVRGALDVGATALGPAVRTLYDPLAGPRAGVADFGRALVTGDAPAAAPAVPQVAVPAPLAPIKPVALPTMLDTPRIDAPATHAAVGPAMPSYSVRAPVSIGIGQQLSYADAQRAAVLDAAHAAAADGHPDNASYRYAAALHGLPQLSGSNNFATLQAQAAQHFADVAERERANIRTTEQARYNTDTNAEQVRRNIIPTVIGETINPDLATRPFAPTIKVYGTVSRSADGSKYEVRDMQGNLQKPAEAPKVSVGVRVTQKDGTYPLEGGKSAVVKGGVVTEIK